MTSRASLCRSGRKASPSIQYLTKGNEGSWRHGASAARRAGAQLSSARRESCSGETSQSSLLAMAPHSASVSVSEFPPTSVRSYGGGRERLTFSAGYHIAPIDTARATTATRTATTLPIPREGRESQGKRGTQKRSIGKRETKERAREIPIENTLSHYWLCCVF